MDSLTQIVLGAGVGEALLGRKVGNKAILWGGILGTIPDLDVIPTLWMEDIDALIFHRGFSHSLVFCMVAAPLFAWLLRKIYPRDEATFREWTAFSFWVLFTHPILDCFTSWGTQLFWPLDYRVALNTIFVVDPLYTVPFLISIVWLMFYNRQSRMRQRVNYAGLIISTAYLTLTVVNKYIVNDVFEESMRAQQIEFRQYSTKPSPFNNILWSVVAETDDGYYLGYYSFFDKDREIEFDYVDKQHYLLSEMPKDENLKTLLYNTKGYYSLERDSNKLLLHDLRFGQTVDPVTRARKFIFTFFIQKNGNAEVVIKQKPRDTDDISGEMFVMLWRRMLGVKEIFS